MHIHEYEAKGLFARYAIPVPAGRAAFSTAEARAQAEQIGGERWVVKAQIHAGGRGKVGGVKVVQGREALGQAAEALLGATLVTAQTGPQGQRVERLLIEAPAAIARELYVACLVDRERERVVVMASAAGGMDIEMVAAQTPERIHKAIIDPIVGLQAYQGRELAFALDLTDRQVNAFAHVVLNLYRLFVDNDLSLVEINPLVVTESGELLAVDGKINVDDNALYRQKTLAALRDASQEDPKEHKAHEFGLNYIALSGNIGCMVNGAGLAMATMDLIKLHGGQPANFLDVGGGTTVDKVAEAFKLITADPSVKAILVNIFGGIVRCDLIAEGIIGAVREVGLTIPVVVRLEGTNAEQGLARLAQSGLAIQTAQGLTEAAQRVVAAAGTRA